MKTQTVVMGLRLLFIWMVYVSWHCFRSGVAAKQKNVRKRSEKKRSRHLKSGVAQSAAIGVLAIVLFTPASAQIVELVLHGDAEEEVWIPTPLPAVKTVEDVLPRTFSLNGVEGSLMLSLADGIYASEKTEGADIERESNAILLMLERHRSIGEEIALPTWFELHQEEKCYEYRVAGTLAEYDGQIAAFMERLECGTEEKRKEKYNQIGITALNALQLCKETGVEEPQSYLYFAELTFWAFANEYVLGADRWEQVDLFYRIGQAYDYLGLIAKDLPDFRYRMYFLSAAFLDLSCDVLEENGFSREGVIYWGDTWHLYLTMVYRLGLYMDNRTEYFQLVSEYAEGILKLDLTQEEERKLKVLCSEIEKWPM